MSVVVLKFVVQFYRPVINGSSLENLDLALNRNFHRFFTLNVSLPSLRFCRSKNRFVVYIWPRSVHDYSTQPVKTEMCRNWRFLAAISLKIQRFCPRISVSLRTILFHFVTGTEVADAVFHHCTRLTSQYKNHNTFLEKINKHVLNLIWNMEFLKSMRPAVWDCWMFWHSIPAWRVHAFHFRSM